MGGLFCQASPEPAFWRSRLKAGSSVFPPPERCAPRACDQQAADRGLSGASLSHLSAPAAIVLYPLPGCSREGARWFNCFTATGEFFHHSNCRAPGLLKYFRRYRDAAEFAPQCGFPRHNERKLAGMLVFRDVYHDRIDRRPRHLARDLQTREPIGARERACRNPTSPGTRTRPEALLLQLRKGG